MANMTNDQKADFIEWLRNDDDFLYELVAAFTIDTINTREIGQELYSVMSACESAWFDECDSEPGERQYYDKETGGLL